MTDAIHIDFETRSAVDLKKTGVYVYAADPTTELWCVCYALGDGPVQVWRPGEPCPDVIMDHVLEGGLFVAHNANFERTIWSRILGPRHHWPIPNTAQWRCTMVMAQAQALPGALADAAPAAGLTISKDEVGKRLMLQMARPRKRDPLTWWDEPAKIARLIEYCIVDVEVERQLEKRLRPLKDSELDLWHLDCKINDRGVHVDVGLCLATMKIVERVEQGYDLRMLDLTDKTVTACSNRNQLITWLRLQGLDTDSVAKDQLEEMLSDKDLPPVVREVLELRRASAKASVAKIEALMKGMDADRAARGMLQFHAASTGRWAGRRFQPQNIKRPDMDLEEVTQAIPILRTGDYDLVAAIYDEPLSTIGDCIRGMIEARPGHKMVAADYSNIEGRVLAWLAGEDWKLDAFRAFDTPKLDDRGEKIPDGKGDFVRVGHDLYKITAGGILGKDPAAVTKPERQAYGKVPELALGYQGGVGAFQTMAVNYGVDLSDSEVEGIRDGWREKHPAIKQYWYTMEEAAIEATLRPGEVVKVGRYVRFKKAGSFLFMRLPSGRFLSYSYPQVMKLPTPWKNAKGETVYKDMLTHFATINISNAGRKVDKKSSGKWARISTYGGCLVENATQAVARDVMADAMPRVEAAGYPIVLTVHDELVTEPKKGRGSLAELCSLMVPAADWAAGLPVSVAGFEAERYGKGE